jgi:hypothetical protein
MLSNSSTNQGVTQRVSLLIASVALIVVTLQTSGVLGWMAMLPLIAIYPGISAMTGWDPINAVFSAVTKQFGGAPKTLAHQN